jgi:hypothetical protein
MLTLLERRPRVPSVGFLPFTGPGVMIAGDLPLVGNITPDRVFAQLATANLSTMPLATVAPFQPPGLLSLAIYQDCALELH